MRDYQQSRVYGWEQTVPNGGRIDFQAAQAIVNHIWEGEGLKYPPTVVGIHSNTTKWAGHANRFEIALQPDVSLRTIIHEVAHSMTSDMDGNSAWHGPMFVGVYTKLIEKYLNVPMPVLLHTLNKHKVDVDVMASPAFLDD